MSNGRSTVIGDGDARCLQPCIYINSVTRPNNFDALDGGLVPTKKSNHPSLVKVICRMVRSLKLRRTLQTSQSRQHPGRGSMP